LFYVSFVIFSCVLIISGLRAAAYRHDPTANAGNQGLIVTVPVIMLLQMPPSAGY